MTGRDNHLPLLHWQPAECQVIPFPMVHRVGKIRRTAEVLAGRSGKGADQYWKQVVGGLQSQMVAAGLPAETIDRELTAFANVVLAQVQDWSRKPDGAA